MKGQPPTPNSQGQVFLKKKKKRKPEGCNSHHENDGSAEGPGLSQASLLLFEHEAAQQEEGRKKKKKSKSEEEKQQPSIANYFVRLEQGVSNGAPAEASQKRKRKRKDRERRAEHSHVTCVPVNQGSPGSCQDSSVDYVYLKTSPKKKKKKKKRKAELPQVDEECEVPPPQSQGKNNREKAKKRSSSSGQDRQEDTDGTAEQSLLSPNQNRQRKDKGCPLPAEKGDSRAASATSELSVQVPADFSTPIRAAGGAQNPPASYRKKIKSEAFVAEESSSESDEMPPEPLASKKEKTQSNSFAEMAGSDEGSLGDDEFLDSLLSSFVDLDTARQELEEFIPHVRNISESSIRKMAGRDLARFKAFKKQGVAVKFGRFTKKENDQIQKNVDEFLMITGIDSAEKLLFTSRFPEEREAINRLKAEHQFCEKISEGIPRPWRLIYYRARKIFDPNNYKGRYTQEEKEKLKKYHAMHGNDWKKISQLMSRSNLSVAMKYSEIKSAINYGPWTREECQKLKAAVKEVLRRKLEMEGAGSPSSGADGDLWVDSEKLCQQLPWTEIEAKVGSRYWRQCKQKWTSILTKKMSKEQRADKGTKSLQNKITLIKRLYEMNVEDVNEINWEELSEAIGDLPKPFVQTQFYRLKVSCVPLWQRKTFSEIIDFLFEHKLPEFEEKLRKMGKDLNSDNSSASQEKKTFRLSDIFDSSEEESD
ncbi:transcription termination factor 1 isoform X2 [Pithys albifrons albifrons]